MREEGRTLIDQLSDEDLQFVMDFAQALQNDNVEKLNRMTMLRFGLPFAEFMAKENPGRSAGGASPGKISTGMLIPVLPCNEMKSNPF